MQINITIKGDKEYLDKLTRLQRKLPIFREAMRDIGENLRDYYAGPAFASEGGVFGERWKTLSPDYQTSKAKRYPGRGILVATGEMRSSFRFKSNNTSATIYNTDPKFEYHQLGSPRGKLTQRRMMGINQPVKNSIQTIIETDISRKLRSVSL
jgi:phage gpG-like protein